VSYLAKKIKTVNCGLRFREFPTEGIIWDEIEKLIQAIEHSNDPLRKGMCLEALAFLFCVSVHSY